MSGFGHRVYKNYDPRAKVSISMHSFEFVDLYGLHLERITRECHMSNIYFESFQGLGNTLYGDFVVGTKLWSHLDPFCGIRNGRIY